MTRSEIFKWIVEHGYIFFNDSIIIYNNEEDLILKAIESFINKYKEEK